MAQPRHAYLAALYSLIVSTSAAPTTLAQLHLAHAESVLAGVDAEVAALRALVAHTRRSWAT